MDNELICQSCAMPLSADPKGGGTEADGSLSSTYCSYCYQNGVFVRPDMTLDEMVAFLKPMMVQMGVSQEQAEPALQALPHLKRWAKG